MSSDGSALHLHWLRGRKRVLLLLLPVLLTATGAVAAGEVISTVRADAARGAEGAGLATTSAARWRLVGVILSQLAPGENGQGPAASASGDLTESDQLQKTLTAEESQHERLSELLRGTPDGDRTLAALDAARWKGFTLIRKSDAESFREVAALGVRVADALDAYAIASRKRQQAAEGRAQAVTVSALVAAVLAITAGWWLSLFVIGRIQRRHLRALHDLSREDPLTKLGNRRALEADFAGAGAADDRVVVAVCDLDGFKLYNDAFGHPAGDALLRRLAGRLRTAATSVGATAYRLGGDEFCVVGIGKDPASIGRLCQAALRESTDEYRVGTSVGVAVTPDDGTTVDLALRAADERLYAAKRARYARFPELDRRASSRDAAAG